MSPKGQRGLTWYLKSFEPPSPLPFLLHSHIPDHVDGQAHDQDPQGPELGEAEKFGSQHTSHSRVHMSPSEQWTVLSTSGRNILESGPCTCTLFPRVRSTLCCFCLRGSKSIEDIPESFALLLTSAAQMKWWEFSDQSSKAFLLWK